jgi:hypothetical protein
LDAGWPTFEPETLALYSPYRWDAFSFPGFARYFPPFAAIQTQLPPASWSFRHSQNRLLTLTLAPYMNGGIPDLFDGAGPVFSHFSENRGLRHFSEDLSSASCVCQRSAGAGISS